MRVLSRRALSRALLERQFLLRRKCPSRPNPFVVGVIKHIGSEEPTMITPLEITFVYEAGRPRTRAQQLAEDARAAELVAGFARGYAALTALGRRLRRA
jgi:hypothetical protein